MKLIAVGAVLGIALAGCGDDIADEADARDVTTQPKPSSTSTVVDAGPKPSSTAADAGPSASCRVPTGTFMLTTLLSGVSGACSLSSVASNTRSSSIELAGSLEDFLSSTCKGTATWVAGSGCVVRAEETCASSTTTREITISADGSTLRGSQTQRDGQCEARASLSGWRATSPSTPATPASTTNGSRLDVQLYYELGVPAGDDGGYLSYSRYRLRSNGTFASCAYELSFGPGVYAGGPARRSQGTYEIVGDALQLRNANGASSSVPFRYSAATGQASIDGKSYAEETPTSDSDLCDFGV